MSAFASSYIPTGATAVTRNADILTYPTTGWLNASAGTMYAEWQRVTTSGTGIITSLNDETLDNRVMEFVNSTVVSYRVTAAAAAQVSANGANAVAANTAYTLATAWATNDFASYLNGTLDVTDATVTIPAGMTRLEIGCEQAGSTQPLFGPIRRVSYYAARLANATLQGLTA